MADPVSSLIFCCRNIDKVKDENKVGRFPVVIAQANNVFQAVKEIDGAIGETAKKTSHVLSKAAKEERILSYAGEGVKFLSEHVNPLICVSAGIDVLRSDNQEKTLAVNGAALGAMFLVESQMKKHLNEIPKMKCLEGITKQVMKFAKSHQCEKGLPAVAHGIAFVVGSCTAYSLGEKFGNLVATKLQSSEAKPGMA